MDRGFYHDENNVIVFRGNRKPIDPVGQIWVNGQWPDDPISHGVNTQKWDGEKIIDNPELAVKISEVEADDARRLEIKTEQENSGLKSITIEQALSFIDSKIDHGDDVQTQVDGIKIFLKKMIPFIINGG